jgi:hypothetical protein
METLPDTQHRVTALEREQAISRLQEAYIRGQLSEDELGGRIDRALAAVVKLDLSDLVSDLPALPPAAPAEAVPSTRRRRPKEAGVYKSTVRKNGAWTVPALFQQRVYKGVLILDLRQALLSSADTVIELDAYKSRVAIIVPPEYCVQTEGNPYKGSLDNRTSGGIPGSPRILVRGSYYKSIVIVADRDPEAPPS